MFPRPDPVVVGSGCLGMDCSVGGLAFVIFLILDSLVSIIIGLTLVGIVWGLAVFVLNAGNADKRNEGKSILLWGVVALFVSLFFRQILDLLANTFLS